MANTTLKGALGDINAYADYKVTGMDPFGIGSEKSLDLSQNVQNDLTAMSPEQRHQLFNAVEHNPNLAPHAAITNDTITFFSGNGPSDGGFVLHNDQNATVTQYQAPPPKIAG